MGLVVFVDRDLTKLQNCLSWPLVKSLVKFGSGKYGAIQALYDVYTNVYFFGLTHD